MFNMSRAQVQVRFTCAIAHFQFYNKRPEVHPIHWIDPKTMHCCPTNCLGLWYGGTKNMPKMKKIITSSHRLGASHHSHHLFVCCRLVDLLYSPRCFFIYCLTSGMAVGVHQPPRRRRRKHLFVAPTWLQPWKPRQGSGIWLWSVTAEWSRSDGHSSTARIEQEDTSARHLWQGLSCSCGPLPVVDRDEGGDTDDSFQRMTHR